MSSANIGQNLPSSNILFENIKDLNNTFDSKIKELEKSYMEKGQSIEMLKSKTENSFSEIRELLNRKEKELLEVLESIDLKRTYLKKEKSMILKKIENLFSEEQISKLKSEQDILNFFSEKEKELNNYIKKSFNDKPSLKFYVSTNIEQIFKKNPSIIDITKDIYSKLKVISSAKFQTENEYKEKLSTSFGNLNLPEFLIDKNIKDLRYKLFLMNNRPKETNALIECYEKIRMGEIKILERINNKYELFLLFVAINNNAFQKYYFGKEFFVVLESNENLIKEYFGENIQYISIFGKFSKISGKEEKNEIENLFQIIEKDINNNINNLLNIISSFYYILFYRFKDDKRYRDLSNIGNVYINLILKNFVIFLDKRFKSKMQLNKSLFELFKELILFDIKFLMNEKLINSKNKPYTYNDIFQIIKNDENLNKLIIKLNNDFLLHDDPIITIKNNISKHLNLEISEVYDENINLDPIDSNINSNTVTIIIDGFADEKDSKNKKKDKNNIERNINRLKKWNDFIEYFKNETNIYFYNWAETSENEILKKGDKKKIVKKSEEYESSRDMAKLSGKLLAYILYSFKFFNEFQINLIGFSLGNYVIKGCLKELNTLNNINKFIKIKNVIFISAINHMKNINLWKKYMEYIIIDKFINCYSTEDDILQALSLIKNKDKKLLSAGNKALILKNKKDVNLVLNYDFTGNKFNHMSYNFGTVAQKICEEYKDI